MSAPALPAPALALTPGSHPVPGAYVTLGHAAALALRCPKPEDHLVVESGYVSPLDSPRSPTEWFGHCWAYRESSEEREQLCVQIFRHPRPNGGHVEIAHVRDSWRDDQGDLQSSLTGPDVFVTSDPVLLYWRHLGVGRHAAAAAPLAASSAFHPGSGASPSLAVAVVTMKAGGRLDTQGLVPSCTCPVCRSRTPRVRDWRPLPAPGPTRMRAGTMGAWPSRRIHRGLAVVLSGSFPLPPPPACRLPPPAPTRRIWRPSHPSWAP